MATSGIRVAPMRQWAHVELAPAARDQRNQHQNGERADRDGPPSEPRNQPGDERVARGEEQPGDAAQQADHADEEGAIAVHRIGPWKFVVEGIGGLVRWSARM